MKLADYTFKDTAIIFIFLPVANIIGISVDENQYQIVIVCTYVLCLYLYLKWF